MADEPAFPEVRWGTTDNPVARAAAAFGATKPGSWLIRTLTPVDRKLLERSKGKYGILGAFSAPTLLLTTTGRKSGLPRRQPLLHYREGNRAYVVGSNFGQQHHPAWTGNLLADPEAVVTLAGKEIPVRATLLDGEERDRVFAEFVKRAKAYDVYRERTTREIRVFRLDPEQR
ncbi:deazaflavin-dependent oxidoreductase (nitroreductase family) [Herbihabitans rhizosphaerae]|uniref:Deazaflavin-dependent oxidoreductase (Nitroreductase family) n=1 Tax=Herbihabitans rhizosphaerae TaxID=1872711 RepID=A0A4Q7KJI3_9PSEU|nr:nitroreductase family deazaflavin-dependent oxidoreductase [Herbihabitans rhizosphaerae]RZS36585.1 deazaflavin-dependent oxidoreductase (nitroreductase family) [Herbihabitans rhizosphaerae]